MALNDNIKQLKMKINSDGTLSENILVKYASQLYPSVTINGITFNGSQSITINAEDIPYDNTDSILSSDNLQDVIDEIISEGIGGEEVFNGSLSLGLSTGATNTALSIVTGTGFNANTPDDYTYNISVGPALVNLSSIMTTGNTSGFLKKIDEDTYAIDTNNYLITEVDTLQTVTSRGATTGNIVRINNVTDSTSSSTGALRVDGGVGISKNLTVEQAVTATKMIVKGTVGTPNTELELVGTFISGGSGPKQAGILGPDIIYIDPFPHGTNSGKVVIEGDLEVTGTTTTINSINLDITDKTLKLAKDTTSISQANGSGIFINNYASLTFNSTRNSFISSVDFEVNSGNDIILNGETSGSVRLQSPDEAGSTIIAFPATSGVVALAGHAIEDLTSNNPWSIFYSDGDNNIVHLSSGTAGKILKSNGIDSAPSWESESFLNLTDTPSGYDGSSNKLVAVNSSSNGLEFVDSIDCGTY
jgi:hypothetical protein